MSSSSLLCMSSASKSTRLGLSESVSVPTGGLRPSSLATSVNISPSGPNPDGG
jgi:hypothetical protein